MSVSIAAPANSHLREVLHGLVQAGWRIQKSPTNGKLRRNGQLMTLKTRSRDTRLRLFVYKVTGSSRGKPNERRIEITSTYKNGRIERPTDYFDVVLGIDTDNDIFVGVDPRRIEEGGPTGNASSFFDEEGLSWGRKYEIHIRQRAAKLFENGVEYHAFFKAPCLGEYLLHVSGIHEGSYKPGKIVRKPVRRVALWVSDKDAIGATLVLSGTVETRATVSGKSDVVDEFERGDTNKLKKRRINQETLLEIKRRCDENGRLGEEFVLKEERRRLKKAGKTDLADKVKLISVESACEGYDLVSYETDGTERYIEVKSTAGRKYVFEMSNNEWEVANKHKEQYFIYRVTDVRTKPEFKIFKNPTQLESEGLLTKSPSGWWVTLK